jgi:hypothetical protein
MRRWWPAVWAIPTCRGSICWNFMRSSTLRVSWCPRPGAGHGAGPAATGRRCRRAAAVAAGAQALLATTAAPDWPERDGAWSVAAIAGQVALALGHAAQGEIVRPERAERWLFARLPEWEEAPSGPSPRKSRSIRRRWKRAWPR